MQAVVSSVSVCRPRYLLLYAVDIRLFSIKTEEKVLTVMTPPIICSFTVYEGDCIENDDLRAGGGGVGGGGFFKI